MPRSAESLRWTQAIGWRVAAVGPFAAAVLANLAYDALRQARGAAAAGLAELCLCLVAFTATWVGVLLLVHGRRVFYPVRPPEAPVPADPLRAVSVAAFEDRRAMAQMLTVQVLARARAAHRRQRLNGAPPQR